MIEIPVGPPVAAGDVHFEMRMLLDGEYFTLTFRWNERDSGWRFSLGNGVGEALFYSVALRVGTPIQIHLRHLSGLPPGFFVCLDSTQAGIDPAFEDLGDRVGVFYVEEADLA